MNEVKWPKYDWEKYGAPLHCERTTGDSDNYFVTNSYYIIAHDGMPIKPYRSKEDYMEVLTPHIRSGRVQLIPFDDTPFEGNI